MTRGSAAGRGARTAIAVVFAGAGLAALLGSGRDPAPRTAGGTSEASGPAPDATAAMVESTTPPPATSWPTDMPQPEPVPAWPGSAPRTERRPDEPGAGLDDRDATSVDTGDWRDTVAAALGQEAVDDASLDAGAVHTHLAAAGADERAPALATSLASGGVSELQGWDGGEFWFGPDGLVRVREVAR